MRRRSHRWRRRRHSHRWRRRRRRRRSHRRRRGGQRRGRGTPLRRHGRSAPRLGGGRRRSSGRCRLRAPPRRGGCRHNGRRPRRGSRRRGGRSPAGSRGPAVRNRGGEGPSVRNRAGRDSNRLSGARLRNDVRPRGQVTHTAMRMGDEHGDQTDQEDATVDDQHQPPHDVATEAGPPALLVDDSQSHHVLAEARSGYGLHDHDIEEPDERRHALCGQEGVALPHPRVRSNLDARELIRGVRAGGKVRAQDGARLWWRVRPVLVLDERQHGGKRDQYEQAIDHVRRDPPTEHGSRIARWCVAVGHGVIVAQSETRQPDSQRSRKLR